MTRTLFAADALLPAGWAKNVLLTWNDIGQLAAIAVIRTFLNHFLEKDLENAGLRPQ